MTDITSIIQALATPAPSNLAMPPQQNIINALQAPIKLAADIRGKGSDLSGPYLPDKWGSLPDTEKNDIQKSQSVFSDDYKNLSDLKALIDKNGTIQIDPRDPTVQQFLKEADPNQYERYNWPGYGPDHQPTGDGLDPMNHTIFLRRVEPLIS